MKGKVDNTCYSKISLVYLKNNISQLVPAFINMTFFLSIAHTLVVNDIKNHFNKNIENQLHLILKLQRYK